MSDENDNADDADQGSDQSPPAGEKTFTQAQLDKIISNRLPEYEGLKSKAAQFDALTASTEDLLAQARSEAEEAKNELAWQGLVMTRKDIAASKGLDPKLWDRVKGETEAEIAADCDELLGIATQRPKQTAGFRSGASQDAKLTDKERAVEALRGLRER